MDSPDYGFEMVERRAKRTGQLVVCWQVRQQAGVVEQLLSIDRGLGYVLKAQNEKLQRLPMIDREQVP